MDSSCIYLYIVLIKLPNDRPLCGAIGISSFNSNARTVTHLEIIALSFIKVISNEVGLNTTYTCSGTALVRLCSRKHTRRREHCSGRAVLDIRPVERNSSLNLRVLETINHRERNNAISDPSNARKKPLYTFDAEKHFTITTNSSESYIYFDISHVPDTFSRENGFSRTADVYTCA